MILYINFIARGFYGIIKSMKKTLIPDFVKVFLWSYDIDKMDLQKDKTVIIRQVLNYGNAKATDWLFSVYSEEEIKEVIKNTPKSQWDKKSLALWSLVFGVEPVKDTRF